MSESKKAPKFLKAGKVVLLLNGRMAGKKAVIVKTFDDGTPDRPYGHCLVAGVQKYPLKITKSMPEKKVAKRSKVRSISCPAQELRLDTPAPHGGQCGRRRPGLRGVRSRRGACCRRCAAAQRALRTLRPQARRGCGGAAAGGRRRRLRPGLRALAMAADWPGAAPPSTPPPPPARALALTRARSRPPHASQVKPFIKMVNYTHLMPTRYALEVELKSIVTTDLVSGSSANPTARQNARKEVKKIFEDKYNSSLKTGKNKWFFQKLRF